MFISKLLGLEDSFSKSLIYVFCLFVFYSVLGSAIYVSLVGIPMVFNKISEITGKKADNHIVG